MYQTKIRKVGNSAVITLTGEVLALLDAKEGDTITLVRSDDGTLKILTEAPAVLEALEAAEAVMDENREALQRLA